MAKTGNHNQKHIFVINDTIAILDLFAALLEDEGYRVTTDGFSIEMVDLLSRVKADRPDLLVLDFLIQDEGKGWQFLQMLRMDRDTRDIPVVVCTAAVKLVEDLQPHLDTMGVGVVLKPFDIDHLLAEIDKMWARRTPNRVGRAVAARRSRLGEDLQSPHRDMGSSLRSRQKHHNRPALAPFTMMVSLPKEAITLAPRCQPSTSGN